MASFCDGRDGNARLAILGIFSHHTNLRYRDNIRRTWLHNLPAASASESVLTRFVLRGVNVSSSVLDESDAHNDVVFVEGRGLVWFKLRG